MKNDKRDWKWWLGVLLLWALGLYSLAGEIYGMTHQYEMTHPWPTVEGFHVRR